MSLDGAVAAASDDGNDVLTVARQTFIQYSLSIHVEVSRPNSVTSGRKLRKSHTLVVEETEHGTPCFKPSGKPISLRRSADV